LKDRKIRAWDLKLEFNPNVMGVEPEISLKEQHHLLLILKTDILFGGLILRKSRLNPDEAAMPKERSLRQIIPGPRSSHLSFARSFSKSCR
jgi:hypothetical protein